MKGGLENLFEMACRWLRWRSVFATPFQAQQHREGVAEAANKGAQGVRPRRFRPYFPLYFMELGVLGHANNRGSNRNSNLTCGAVKSHRTIHRE